MITYYDENMEELPDVPSVSEGWFEYNAVVTGEEVINGITHIRTEPTAAIFHPFTEEEKAAYDAEIAAQEAEASIPVDISDLQDAVIEVAELASDNELSISDIEDALIELAELIGGAE